MPLNEENQLAPLPTLASLDPESEEYKNAVKLFETEPPKTPRPPDLMPEGMATDTAPIYTQPDKTTGFLERIRLESEKRTGVETTIPRAMGRLVGSVLFGGDERKVEQKNALTGLAKGEWLADDWSKLGPMAPGTPGGVTAVPKIRVDFRTATPQQIEGMVKFAGLDPDQIGRDFEGRMEWEKANGETRDPRDVLADVVSAEAENTLRQRVHVSSRAAAALPEGGKNEKGFGYSFLGGGLMNLPYMGTYALSFATGMGPILPLLASYDRRLQANSEDKLGFTEEGDLGIVKPAMSPEEAEIKAWVGAAKETAIEVAGGKVVGAIAKPLAKGAASLASRFMPKAVDAISKFGQDVIRNNPSLRKFVEFWNTASEITQVQKYPVETLEEYADDVSDDIFKLSPDAPEGNIRDRFVAANKKFKGQLGDILLTLAFIQGPQAITAGAKTVGYAQKEKAAERGAAEWLKVAGVSDEQAKEILANGDARAAVEYVTSDETRRQEIAKRVSDRSARIADDLLKTNEWMEDGGGKNAVSRFVPPTPADLKPGEDGIARYESSGVGIEYDAPNNRIAVTDTRTGRQAFVFGGQTPAEGMEQAFAIADSFDREAQGRDAVNAKKRELLAKALEARGVDGTYILVDNPEQLMTQASEKARVALAQKAEEGAIPQAFVDTDENGNVKTFFILDNIRMGKGKDALGQSVNNIVEAATHEPVHVAQFSPKAAKTFNAIFDQADDDLKMDVIRYGISKELGTWAVDGEVKRLSSSTKDDVYAADSKLNALRRWFREGMAYLTEGNLTDTTTGAQKLARRVRDFFKAGVAGVSDIRVLAERGLAQARGPVRIIDTRMQEAEQISTAAKPAGAVSGAASEQTGALPIAPGADGAGQAQEMNRPTGASQPETLITSEEKKTVSVPVMITKKMERDLLGKGYEQSAIDKMTPSEAWEALQKPTEEEAMPEPPEGAEPPPVEEETTAPAVQATAEAVQPEAPSNVVGQPEIVPTAVAPKEAVAPISAPQEPQKGTEVAVGKEVKVPTKPIKPPKKETRPQAVARVKKALAAGEPVPAADVDRLGVKIPDTYGREGDNYVKLVPSSKSAETGSEKQTSTEAAPSVPAQGVKTPAEGLGGGGTGTAEGVAERARPSVGEKVTFNSNVSALKNGQLLQPHTGKVIRVPELPEVDFVVYKTPDSLWAVAEYTTGQRPGPVYGETKEVSIQRLKDNLAKYGANKIRQAISEAPVLNVFSVKSVQKPTTQKEAKDAEAVRGDEGQVREGKPRQGDAAEAGVRQGAVAGGGDLQFRPSAQEAPRGGQGAVKAPELTTPEEYRKAKPSPRATDRHAGLVISAWEAKKPLLAKTWDEYNGEPPPGYVREGDLYVFKPETPTPPDDGGKKPVPPAREPEAQTLQSKTPSSDVSGREISLSKIPKGARVATTKLDSGVSYRGEFVKDNGDGTATLRAFGEKPATGLFRRYGTDAKGVQIAKDVTVPLASVKSVEPPADLGKLTPAQRSAVRRAAKAQEAAMEAEIAAGETAGADVAGRMASAEERRERARTDNETMFRTLRPAATGYDLKMKLKPLKENRENVKTAIAAIHRQLVKENVSGRTTPSLQVVEPVYDDATQVSPEMGRATIAEIERIFQKTIVFVDGGDVFGGIIHTKHPDFIFINPRSESPYLQIAGHELWHTMEQDNPALYNDVLEALTPALLESDVTKQLVKNKVFSTPGAVDEYLAETTANLFGQNFSEPEFWNLVAERNPTLFQRLTDYVLEWIEKVFSSWRGERMDATPFYGDLKNTRKIVANAVSKYAELRQLGDTMFRVTPAGEQLQQTEGTENEQRNVAERFALPAIALPDSIQREMQGGHREKLAEDLRGVHRQYQKDLADDGEDVRFRVDRSQTETPEFKRWFGDSKVVDADGKPLVVYRGDRTGKTVFTGREDPSNYIQGNVFFTSEPFVAAGYSAGRRRVMSGLARAASLDEKEGLYRAYLSIEKPLIVDAKGEGWDSVPFEGRSVQIDDLGLLAQKRGYDGMIVENVFDQYGESTQYVAFRPEQIKSATGNVGTFDPTNPDIRFRVSQPQDAEDLARAQAQFAALRALMDKPPEDFYKAKGEPDTPIVAPVVLDRKGLEEIAKATGTPLQTPAHVSQKSEVRDALADYSEDFVRSAMDRINREGRPIETNDTVVKIREFERRRLQDAEVAAVEMDTAIRNGNVGRQLALLDEKEALVRDLDQAAQALSLVGSERGRQLAFLKYGLDRNLSIIYRLQRLRKASGAPVTLEQYEKMVAEIARDKAEMKKLAEEHERVVAEVEKETRAKTVKEVEERMNKEVLAAYRKGAEAERSAFETILAMNDNPLGRLLDYAVTRPDTADVPFRTAGERKENEFPQRLREIARAAWNATNGLGWAPFGVEFMKNAKAAGFNASVADAYLYDFARRMGVPVLAKPAEKWKPTAPKMEAGNPKKEGPAVKRRERAVKEAVRLAVAENMLADGGKIAEIAAKNLEGTEWEGITPLEVMEIVTGYPVQPDIDTRDELDRRVAMVRKHMLALQRLQELEQNKYPTKMSLPADKPDVTLRQLARELRDRMNDFQFPAGQEDERLLNAERALASRLRYAVEELQKAVDAGTPINEKAPRAVAETPEIAELRRTLKDLRAAYEALPAVEAIKEARDAERARRAANKRYHFWQKRAEDAKNGVFPETSKAGTTAERDAEAADYAKKAEAARREYWAIKKASPQERVRVMSEKVAKAEERLADLEAKLALPVAPDLRAPKKPEATPASPEEAALARTLAERRAAIERVKKAISARWREENADAISAVKEAERYQFLVAKAEMLEDRIRRGDFSKAPVRPRVWSARIAEVDRKVSAGLRAINERIEWEANAAAGIGGKIQNYRVKGREVYKFFKTMWDLSAVGVQSARLFGYDPIYGTKLIGQTAMNAMSDEDAARFQEAMHNDADYEKAFGAGLALDQNYEDIFGTGMGESFMRDLERWGTGPDKGVGKRLVGGTARVGLASQRAFEMYGRMIRFHVFKSIINDPAHANLSKDELRTIANMVNIMGGVGNTKFYYRDIASVMSRLMWSSRLFTSQWQTLTGGGGLLWNAGMARETSRAKLGRKWYQTAAPGALKLYSRSLAGTVALSWVFGSIGMLLGDRQPWEDEETMFWKAFDFLFGRRVIGSKSIDTFGGLTSYTALVKRAFKGSHVTMSGKTQPDDDWKAWAQTFANFARGRLRPDISLALSAVFGEDVTGQPFGPRGGAEGMKNLAIEAAFPITPGDMQETVADMWDTHGVAGVTLGLVSALASDLFGFSKGSAPRDPRYEINRHKAHLGQVRKALKEYREAPDQKKLEAYQALAVKYSFDRGVEESIAALDRAGNAADKIAKDTKRPEAQRTEAVKAAKLYWEKARDILRASR